MRDFNKGGGFKKSFDRGHEEKRMYQATCGDCGKSCEVPFRPTGERPVYCRDCFSKHPAPTFDRGERSFRKPFERSDRPAGRSFGGDRHERPAFRPEAPRPPRGDDAQTGALTQEIKLLSSKIDNLIRALDAQHARVETPVAPVVAKEVAAVAKKPAKAKKVAASKKK